MLPKQQIVDQTTPCSKTNLQVSDNDVLLTQSGSNEQLADDAKDGQNSQPEQINKENDIAMTGAGMEECQEKLLSEINDSGINMQTDNIPSETLEGEYFSEEEMKFREPFLYDQMIGQYLTDDEIQAQVDKSDLRFSSILIRHMDLLDENARFARDKDKEDGQMEEEEEDSEEESELESDTENKTTDTDGGDNEKRKTIPEKERQELRQEFITIMQEKFLSGKDKNFDYSKVDNNEQYDDLDVLNLDAEEKYFDDEDSNSVHSVTTMETVNTMET